MNTTSKAGEPAFTRRDALALLATMPLATHLPAAQAAVPTDRITVLYRRENGDAPTRLDAAVQFATLALERELRGRGYTVVQPAPAVYQLMDQGQAVIVTFAEDAGFTLVFSLYRSLRPRPGSDSAIAEVRLQARVHVGRNILVAEEARGQMFTLTDAGSREFGERRALEQAASQAAKELAERAVSRLKALSVAEINALVGNKPTTGTTGTEVGLPLPAPTGPVGVPEAPPSLPPTPAPAPAPLPAPAPVPVPAPVLPPPPPVPVPAPAPAPVPVAPAPAPGTPLPAPRNRYALVVGMSNYASVRANGVSQITDLPGVARDTSFVVDSLRSLGFSDERMLVLRDERATSNNIRTAMSKFAALVGPEDVFVMFISAHGADKDASFSGYGMPVLADFTLRRENGELDFWQLQSLAKNLRGRVVWINDTCHSGGAATGVQSVVVSSRGVSAAGEVRGPDASTVARAGAPGQDFAILTASSPQEISWETAEGGLFTTRLFGALRKSRGQQPLGVLFADGVQREVIETSKQICQRQKACTQHPQQTPIFAYGGSGNLIRL